MRAIALGTLRWYRRLRPALVPLVSRPFEELSPKLAALLVTTAHQVEYSRGAAEAQVHLAVDASRVIGEGRASGVVNAVLRKFVAQRTELSGDRGCGCAPAPCSSAVVGGGLRVAWGELSEQRLVANNEHRPMVLRLDPAVMTSRSSSARCGRSGAMGTVEWNRDAAVLDRPAPVQVLPGFETGAVSVQDGGAELAAPLHDAQPGMRVLDACAAPGGKTLHIAQRRTALAELIAVDDDPLRLARVRENLERAGRDAMLVNADLRSHAALVRARAFQSCARRCACWPPA